MGNLIKPDPMTQSRHLQLLDQVITLEAANALIGQGCVVLHRFNESEDDSMLRHSILFV